LISCLKDPDVTEVMVVGLTTCTWSGRGGSRRSPVPSTIWVGGRLRGTARHSRPEATRAPKTASPEDFTQWTRDVAPDREPREGTAARSARAGLAEGHRSMGAARYARRARPNREQGTWVTATKWGVDPPRGIGVPVDVLHAFPTDRDSRRRRRTSALGEDAGVRVELLVLSPISPRRRREHCKNHTASGQAVRVAARAWGRVA
jgi:hypothetical protein